MTCNVVYCYRAAQESTEAGWTESNRLVMPEGIIEPAASAEEDYSGEQEDDSGEGEDDSGEEEVTEMPANLSYCWGETQVCCYGFCNLHIFGCLHRCPPEHVHACTACQPQGCTILCLTASHTLLSLHPICIPGLLMGRLMMLMQKAANFVAHMYQPQQYMHNMCCHAELVLLVQEVRQVTLLSALIRPYFKR